MGYDRWDHWDHFPPSTPIAVKNGLKARSQHGKIGETWWSSKWVAFLESLDMGARLGRGKSYARRGQVMNMDIQPGLVTAKVQGSRPKPYAVTIRLTPLSPDEWHKVVDAMASQALFAAKLLAGEMPQNIEEAFQAAKVSLFPSRPKDLDSDCSCPDWANPCKHVAAVFFLLAEEFDRDPFMIFKLRGKDKDSLVRTLRERRTAGTPPEAAASEVKVAGQSGEASAVESGPRDFWGMGPEIASFRVRIAPPEVPLATLKRLGKPDFWKGNTDIMDALGKVYEAASREALKIAYDGDGGNGGH
ncbi:MAG: SWIM zinc finger family protein [Chloroflexi bacterium]|nr:SWIM zinc finger family protein [Chloroflexota bacterium]